MLWRKGWLPTCTMLLLIPAGCAAGPETLAEPGLDAAGADVCCDSCADSASVVDADTDPDSNGPTDSAAKDIYAEADADGEPEAGPDATLDVAKDVELDVPLDSAHDALFDATPDAMTIETWTDPGSGIEWLLTMTYSDMIWQDAVDYCPSLGSGWHLPTVAELRTAILGCASTEVGGACSVSDGCNTSSCETGACAGCSGPGPGLGGCYRDDHLKGACEWFWSSTPCSDLPDQAWAVNFHSASVSTRERAVVANLWCVR
ncbi:MAG: DUF1566 domain-containing protein [Deltaproteobacteria bacterium]|nr:DUF1566 domain-containing protein [Deltaproteobacteria bacterium]